MNDELPQKKVLSSNTIRLLKRALCRHVYFKVKDVALQRSKAADRWSLRCTEMPVRCVLDCEIDGQRVGGRLRSRNGQMVVCGMWLGDFTANTLQAGELDPARTTKTDSTVSFRKLWGQLRIRVLKHLVDFYNWAIPGLKMWHFQTKL